jgi:hypothetical protein
MAHRGNVAVKWLAAYATTAVFIAICIPHVAADPAQPCEVVPMPCTFEAQPFKIRVVDTETREPLADVHALAEWQVHGAGGRLNGPLMTLDAVSGPDGWLSFPGWGPVQGSFLGLGIGRDPLITLFKTGYGSLLINNGYLPPARERERVRRFAQDGRTYELTEFRGTPEEWRAQLDKVLGLPRNDEQSLKFREQYLNRLRRVSAEREKFTPEEQKRPGGFFWHLDRTLKFLEEGHR